MIYQLERILHKLMVMNCEKSIWRTPRISLRARLALAIVVFISTGAYGSSSFDQASINSCSDLLSYTVLPFKGKNRNSLKFGDRVVIRDLNNKVKGAFFIGIKSDRVYFAPIETAGLSRPIFYLSTKDVQFQSETHYDERMVLVKSLDAKNDLVEMYRTEAPDACAAQTAITCLMHLDQMGLLSKGVRGELKTRKAELFQAMLSSFGRDSLNDSAEGRKFLEEIAQSARHPNSVIEKMRAWAFGRVTDMLSGLNVSSEVTSSYSDLIQHLKKGKPAYISVNGASIGVARPSLAAWDEAIPWNDPDVKMGTIPIPTWAPSSRGFHAVYALGVLPRASGFGGFLRGHRIVVLDPVNGELNIWDTFILRFSRSAKFILIGN